ncbi:hypothetical protein Ddc_12011 [Ditylenchus destructor]|nr:hypothetical protein Ddc_12011 [Ditylenchus destructor]
MLPLHALAIFGYILAFEQCLLVKANPDFTEATIVKKSLNSEISNSAEGYFLEFKINGASEKSSSMILYCNKKNAFYINWKSASQSIDTSQLKHSQPKLVEEMMKIVTKSKNPEHTWNADPIKLSQKSDVQVSNDHKSSSETTQFAVAMKKSDKWILRFDIPEERARGIVPIQLSKTHNEFYINWNPSGDNNIIYALDVTELSEEKVAKMKKDVPTNEENGTRSSIKIVLKSFVNITIDWLSPPTLQKYADEKLRNIGLFFTDDDFKQGVAKIYTLPYHSTLHYINYHKKRYIVDMSRIGEAERKKIIDLIKVDNEHEPDQNNFPFAGYVIQVLESKIEKGLQTL